MTLTVTAFAAAVPPPRASTTRPRSPAVTIVHPHGHNVVPPHDTRPPAGLDTDMAIDPEQTRYLQRAATGRTICPACTATFLLLLKAAANYRLRHAPPPDGPG